MNEHQGVSWGKILVGAAVAAGAIAVVAFNAEAAAGIFDKFQDFAGTAYTKIGETVAWAWDALVGKVDIAALKAAEGATTSAHAVGALSDALSGAGKSALENLPGLDTLATAAKDATAALTAKAAELTAASGAANQGLLGLLVENKALSIGAATVAGGLIAARGGHAQRLEQRREESVMAQSHALSESTRRMQALLAARMAATGYAPAMAMSGQSRG